MSEWQPIETAPRDGTRILLGGCTWSGPNMPENSPAEAHIASYELYRNYAGWEYELLSGVAESGYGVSNPTHWMLLPELPK